MKKILMCEGLQWNDNTYTGSHHLRDFFIKSGFQVFWLTSPISIFHFLKFSNFTQNKKKLLRWILKGTKHGDNFEYTPFVSIPYKNLPGLKSKWVINNIEFLIFPDLLNILETHGFQKVDVIWFTLPFFHFLLDKIEYKKSFYRVADLSEEFSDYPKYIKNIQKKIIQRVDKVFCVSNYIFNEIRQYTEFEKLSFFPNGVEFEHFYNDKIHEIPGDLNSIPEPRIMYTGVIAEWFDVDLLYRIAIKMPQISFVLIGPILVKLEKEEIPNNVYFLGKRAYKELPAYLTNARVGIITFKKSKLIDTLRPLKLFEYFASGLPVVTTSWKELEHLKPPAEICSSAEEFCISINNCLNNKTFDKSVRLNFAKKYSWAHQFNELLHEF